MSQAQLFPERNAEIVSLCGQGVGPREIARRLSMTPGSVAGVLHRAGLSTEPRGRGHGKLCPSAMAEIRRRRICGETLRGLADEFDVDERTIRHVIARDTGWASQ